MNKQEVEKLFEKYNKGLASPQEQIMLERWYHQELAKQQLSDDEADFVSLKEEIWDGVLDRAGLQENKSVKKLFPLWAKIAAAASIVLLISIGINSYLAKRASENTELANANKIAPGSNKAILTLSNGQKISLTDASKGTLANESGIVITKTADGQLTYKFSNSTDINASALINTIETPRGGQHQITLPDGTVVTLNAASSLKFPASFTGLANRKVELSGEAYFEVAKDKKHPFIVQSGSQEVEVLGTHFNVNTYPDEKAAKTTLLEGSVKVSANGNAHLLIPGQQSILTNNTVDIVTANIKETMAWKNGYFRFNDDRIDEIMPLLSRWYDVEVNYEGKISDERFSGTISRYKNINEVLAMLSYSNAVKFKIEGRRITVMK
ncbi:FecR family protein [Solitalea canadensis]|uniref:Fe2+-dicitrate sensor, membrane component n=1 Tax=Solitalea canadensis (strain ATCC 29591 / DSM 3403 / JCM 21819 / LMG 8368 / NBRC 15130 / NCIMB 12057 / USAM 9D) TaxID=929556 RepID=H8KT55_SOLCM|nr:FecR family protein [Solitalea canadensis]AFD05238.1 Fe2+-dicitrate sensor, membrane component [Solitalea canadensis DSM 3403]